MTAKPGDIGIVEHRLYPSIFEIVRVVRSGGLEWTVERWDGDWRPAKAREVRTWLPLPEGADVPATMATIRALGEARTEKTAVATLQIQEADAEYRQAVSALAISPIP